MANSVTARFNDNCKVHVAMSDDTTVTKAVIIDADGNETDIGGGGESDFIKANVVITNSSQSIILRMMPTTTEATEKILGFVWGVSGVTIPELDDAFPTGTYTCYIRSGEYIFFYSGSIIDGTSYTVTGNAEIVPGDSSVDPAIPAIVKVTGDCTITIS